MRRKQLFAVLLAGALTVGMAPTAAFAAEDASTLTIEGTAEETTAETPDAGAESGTETTPGAEVTPEAPTTPPTEAPAEEPVQTPTETPVETPTETPAQEEPNDQAAQTQGEAQATPTPEVKEGTGSIIMGETTYDSIQAAVDAATGTLEEPAKIIVSGEIELSETVTVSSEKYIILASATEGTTIKRAAGFAGEMFKVDGGNLQMSIGSVDEEESTEPVSGSLTVDGTAADDTAVSTGSIISVASGNFVLCEGVTLTGNMIEGNGGAISNTAGTVSLYGGTITGNQAGNGGAIYSEGVISVKGTVTVTENTKYGDVVASNIALKGSKAGILVSGAITDSTIGVQVLEGKEGTPVVKLADDVTDTTLAEAVAVLTYEGEGFTIGEDGTLKSTAVTTPTPTPVALTLKGISMEWTGPNSAKVVCVSNKDGWYYADWVTRGSTPPEFDLEKEGVEVKANKEFTIYFNNLDSEHDIDIYVRVKDTENNISKKMLFRLDGDKRPNPSPTPAGRDPIIPAVSESVVQGLEEPLAFYPNTFYPFTVIGAGSDNTDPIQGDVKWVPLYWAMSSNPSVNNRNSTWKIGASAGISQAGTYNIYIFFQKYEYNGAEWAATDVIESATYKFSSKAITITASPTPTSYNGQQGMVDQYGNPITPTTYETADGSVTGTSSTADSVSTADESPIGTMSMLAVAALLAGGYVVVRKRKKEI